MLVKMSTAASTAVTFLASPDKQIQFWLESESDQQKKKISKARQIMKIRNYHSS